MISRRTLVTLVVRGLIVRNDSKYKSLTKRDILNKLQDYFRGLDRTADLKRNIR